MTNPPGHESYWSVRLLALLQEMAAKRTNAVLTLLGNIDHLEAEHHYPESSLSFAENRWRAFYHCHETTVIHPKEHGHFHIFTDIGNRIWAHVAGLSIDHEGQPIQWFTVNRWVTDGPWLERDTFPAQLKHAATDDKEGNLVARWLVALLQINRDALSGLLIERDEQLQLNLKGRSKVEALHDRDIYTLATQSIDLQSMLENHLLHKPPRTPARTLNV
ncbi:MAG: hypothetical protein ABFS24_14590 [Pseudomonadota bacterium]